MSEPRTLAALDLGSNSFHMIIARVINGGFDVVDRLKERVQLAAGLGPTGLLDEAAQARALECAGRFAERLSQFPSRKIRAVGTHTLRKAKQAGPFVSKLKKTLGCPIEILPGREEARLIYVGVAHTLASGPGRRLVVDIGGGSTECIVGEGFSPLDADSLSVGCVGHSKKHFSDGELSKDRFREAIIDAQLEMEGMLPRYKAIGWSECAGSSGTILAVHETLRANGWSENGITAEGLKKLRKALIACGEVKKIRIAGLSDDRTGVIAGGVAILCAIFEGFGIDRMAASTGALREGLLYDTLGRNSPTDARDETVRRMCERYLVDAAQGTRVAESAKKMLEQVAGSWNLDVELSERLLRWAAQLHEVGLAVSYAAHHKHGGYLVAHSDLPGFSFQDKDLLALLVQNHRRKFVRPSNLPAETQEMIERLIVILRLSVLLNRSRGPDAVSVPKATAKDQSITLRFPDSFLDDRPLTRADLNRERQHLESGLGIELRVASHL